MSAARYLTDRQLAEERGISRATVWRHTQLGLLPQPVKLSPGCTRWLRSEVDAMDARLAANRPSDAA